MKLRVFCYILLFLLFYISVDSYFKSLPNVRMSLLHSHTIRIKKSDTFFYIYRTRSYDLLSVNVNPLQSIIYIATILFVSNIIVSLVTEV